MCLFCISRIYTVAMESQQLDSVAEVFKCCVCLDIPQQFTTLLCCHPNGHLLCYECFTRLDVDPRDNLKHCPYCRVGILSLANKQYAFQNVFNLLCPMFMYACTNYAFGCRHNDRGLQMAKHEHCCDYSPAKCPMCGYTTRFEVFYSNDFIGIRCNCLYTIDNDVNYKYSKYTWIINIPIKTILTPKGRFTKKAKIKPHLLRSRPTFRLVLIANILNSDCMHIQLLWLDSKKCADAKQAYPLYFVIHLHFNGIDDSGSIGCVTPPVFQDDIKQTNGLLLTKSSIRKMINTQKQCQKCKPINDADYLQIRVRYDVNVALCQDINE